MISTKFDDTINHLLCCLKHTITLEFSKDYSIRCFPTKLTLYKNFVENEIVCCSNKKLAGHFTKNHGFSGYSNQ